MNNSWFDVEIIKWNAINQMKRQWKIYPEIHSAIVFSLFILLWKLYNVITETVLIQLIWSNLPSLSGPKSLFYLLIVIIQLMLSVSLCAKVITLSGFHCFGFEILGKVWHYSKPIFEGILKVASNNSFLKIISTNECWCFV